jgi:hypothetical protein
MANPCQSDHQKYCPDVDPGKGQLMKCLDDHLPSLTPACQKEMKEFKAKTLKSNPCFTDLAEWCKDIPSIEEKVQICLLKNENRLSTTCAADFKKKKPQILKNNPCAEDTQNFCYDKLSGEDGMVARCLIKNVTKLKPTCQVKIKKQIADMKIKNPCFDDTEKHCPDMVRVFDIDTCLTKKITLLAPQCKKVIDEEIRLSKVNPCHQDIKKGCKPGLDLGGINRCLTVNEKSLSSACQSKRKDDLQKMSSRVKNCEPDRVKFCKDVPPQGGKILECLRKNKATLSPNCQKVI